MARPDPDDDFEDDRPRRPRGRDDFDDDRPAGRTPAKTMSVLGLVSLLIGVTSLIVSFIPCVGSLAILSGGLGVLLGGVGLLIAGGSNHGKGLPVSGVVVNLLSVLVAVAWLVVLGAMGKRAEQAQKAQQAEMDAAAAIPVSAAQLCRDFETNVVKAEETYKGRVVEVTGQVKLVSRERLARITVELGGQDDTIDCDFGSADRGELTGVEVGRTVTVRGRCKGADRRSKYVVIETCKLVKADADAPAAPAVKVAAAKLLGEYDADEAAADKAYKGKVVEASGEVAEVRNEGKKERVLVFRVEEDGRYLECRLTPEAMKEAGAIRAGQKLTVRGTCSGSQVGGQCVLIENAAVVK